MQNWKRRLRASGIHLSISLCVASLAAILVFGLWYPYPYREISGGRALFFLVAGVDVVMGPLITLIIFNSTKPRQEMAMDFTVVGLLQMAALSYGLWTVFVARPVHLVFEYSRMSVVHAIEVDPVFLDKAPASLQKLPVTGPTAITLRPFRDAAEEFDATMAAIGGVPLAARTDLWRPYADGTVRILEAAKPAADLISRFPNHSALIGSAIERTGKSIAQLRTLPLVGRDHVWTVLLDSNTAEPLEFLPLDSL